ncbi:MAG: hypothetical protein ACFCU4_07370 [Puniceicoccaceae bacterium]
MRNRKFVSLILATLTGLHFGGCSSPSVTEAITSPPVKASPAHAAISQYLIPGGIFNLIIDTSNDAAEAASFIQIITDQLVEAGELSFPEGFEVIQYFEHLGLTNLHGVGLSSHRLDENRFHNRTFFYTPGGREGLFRISGGQPAPFRILEIAPATADLAIETDFNFKVLNEIIGNLAEAAAGDLGRGGWTAAAVTPIPGTPITTLDILNQLDTRIFLWIDFDESGKIVFQSGDLPVEIPQIHFFFRIESLAGLITKLKPQIMELGLPLTELENGFEVKIPVPEDPSISGLNQLDLTLKVDSQANSLTFVSHPRLLTGSPAETLRQGPGWKDASIGLPDNGNGLSYFSPQLNQVLQTLLLQLARDDDDEVEAVTAVISALLPIYPVGSASVSQNLEDGILVFSNELNSHKRNLLSLAFFNPIQVGLLSAMAVPAFHQVRAQSEEKTVINNLRMISSAGMQFMLDEGVDSVTYEQLLATDPPYILPIKPVAGESYEGLTILASGGILQVFTYQGPVTFEY